MNIVNETGFSKDYELLCELVKAQRVVCVYTTEFGHRMATTAQFGIVDEKYPQPFYTISSFAFILEEEFINGCKKLNLSFVHMPTYEEKYKKQMDEHLNGWKPS